jgi:hypothetical protein
LQLLLLLLGLNLAKMRLEYGIIAVEKDVLKGLEVLVIVILVVPFWPIMQLTIPKF